MNTFIFIGVIFILIGGLLLSAILFNVIFSVEQALERKRKLMKELYSETELKPILERSE